MDFLQNITFRRTRTISEPNINDTNEIISQTMDDTKNSVIDIMSEEEEDEQINILKSEVNSLRSQLKTALQKIELLSMENSSLKQTNADLSKKNEMHNIVNSSPLNKKIQTTKKNKSSPKSKKTGKSQTIETPGCCYTSTSEDLGISQSDSSPRMRINENNPSLPIVKNNICILSGETSNRLYKISQRTNLRNFNICHYRMPNCGLKQILDNVDKKVQNFTHSDYCIIYIGEEDFRSTYNYIELVTFIREKLQALTHTNFIICLPTYKFMINKNLIFNSRIEIFNNLLYLDIETYAYAYILDTNMNLPYTYETYNRTYGSLNIKGLNIVLHDLQDLILDLSTIKVDGPNKQLSELNDVNDTLNHKKNDCDDMFFRV